MPDNPATKPYPVTRRAFGLAILVLSGLQLMVVLDGTVVILALPRLQDELALSSFGSAWMVTAYGLPFAGLMLLGGRIGDSFGRKHMFIVGVALFTSASLLCGIAQNEGMLIAARAIQGTGAALAAPTALALVATTFAPGRVRNQAIAIFGSMMAVGSVGGLVIGGALTEVSWRWIFLINVPIGALILLGAVLRLRETAHHRLSLDVRGAVLGTLACVSLVFGATEGPEIGWDSPVIIGSIVAGLVLLIVFVFAERWVDNPLLPWSLFDKRDRVTTFGAIFLASAVFAATTYFAGLFVQNVVGYSPLVAGVAFIPFTIAAGIGTAAASRLAMTVAPRWLLSGAAATLVIGLLFGSKLEREVSYWPTLALLFIVIGFGIGVAVVIVPLCIVVGVAPQNIGPLAAVGQMFMNLGTPFAIGLLAPVAASRTLALGGRTGKPIDMTPAELDALGSGYTLVLLITAVGALVVGLVALTLRYTAAEVGQAQHAREEAELG
ncbi:MFS transporter [Nocardia sp. NPDC051990]|uniref:MFS transporter n=1 Tax=Nocardia sp. NPDC051990 TaxID=3155285 RepID=UPI003436D2C2